MPTVIFAPHKDGQHDGSVHKQTLSFLQKLFKDDTAPGLHIEPIKGSVDPKVRTGRVNDMYRAVLFKVTPEGGEPHYVFSGVWPHDEAINVASRSMLKINPVNGLPELLTGSQVTAPPAHPVSTPVAVPTPEHDTAALPPLLESVSAGTTLERLVDNLGMSHETAERAMAARTDDEVMEVAEQAVQWEGSALLELAVGKTIDEVRASLGLDESEPPDPGLGEDEQLLAAFRTPAGQMQFAWLEDDEELRRVVEGSDFDKWRVFLHAERAYNGPFRLSGGAGTGKTVVLLHRARMLAGRDPGARIVLTTYTRNLADGMRRQLQLLDADLVIADTLGKPGIYVTGVDAAANQVVGRAEPDQQAAAVEQVLGVGGNRATARTDSWQRAWRDAVEAVGDALPAELRSPAFLDAEYASVILPNRIRRRDGYLRVRRPGRGVALNRGQRTAVWDVVDSYRSSAAVEGRVDFAEVCAIAAELCSGPLGPLADHVLVDEGQDLTPTRWQFLRSLVAAGPDDLFIAEDPQQRIYGQPVVLGRHGIQIVGRSRRLTLNYRTTQQVLQFATGVLEGSSYAGLDDDETDNTGYRSARRGPAPRRMATSSLGDELDKAHDVVEGWIDAGVQPETIGILVRDQRTADQVSRGLADRGVTVRLVTRNAAIAKHPQLMTMHRAKGMEFSRVLIFGADADVVPAAYLVKSVPEGERADVMQRERSLFYVAATRARDELVVMWEGKGSSLLPIAQ
jgi:superfamily I DNA/RNA helicase